MVRMNKIEYQEYLKSDWWRSRRLVALRKANLYCEICTEEQNLEVHHKNYHNLWHEKDEDLVVLCEMCHTKFNMGGFKESRLEIKQKLELPITEHDKLMECKLANESSLGRIVEICLE